MKKQLLTLLVRFLFLPFCVNAQWQHTAGPPGSGSNVYCLLANGTDLFAGTQEEIYFSSDSGLSWMLDTLGFNIPSNVSYSIDNLAIIGGDIIAGQASDVYRRSLSNGASWTKVSMLSSYNSLRFAVIGNNLFAGIWGGHGVYKSTDHGTSWTGAGNGLTNNYISALTASGSNLFAGCGNGIFFSNDSGANWVPINNGLTNLTIQAIAVSGSNLFAATQGGVFISTDNGTSWSTINNGLYPNGGVKTFITSGNKLFAGTYFHGVYLSTNNGASWSKANGGLTNLSIGSFAIVGNNLFVGTGGDGVFKAAINDFTDINEFDFNTLQLTIRPNPFSSHTVLQTNKRLQSAMLTIVNCLGQTVKRIENISEQTIILQRDNLPCGLYFIQLAQDGKIFSANKLLITDK